jgi:succinoglycan biosynthesis protein ExoM
MTIHVVDNDDVQSGREQVTEFTRRSGTPVEYHHAPAHNISVARNAALDAGVGEWIAFIDDDEEAQPGWLGALLEVAFDKSADAVFGPVQPIYRPQAPRWLREGAFHGIDVAWVDGRIETGYTSNVLIRRDAIPRTLRFDLQLGRSGGEDTTFFHAMFNAGSLLAYAPTALVVEPVPEQREALDWLCKRRFRSGQTFSGLQQSSRRFGALAPSAIATGKLLLCAAGATVTLWSPVRSRFWLLRGALHAGVIAGHLGKKPLTLY